MRTLLRCLFLCIGFWLAASAHAAAAAEFLLGPADVIKISVFQNPDMTLETRISEDGNISYPLLGSVAVGGLSVGAAEAKIATLLREGRYMLKPQVNILVMQLRSAQVSVLGQVGRPGRYPIETIGLKVSDMIAIAGGIVPGASEVVAVVGVRAGKPVRWSVDLPALFQLGLTVFDPVVANGDTLYVDRAPVVYIYGEVQRPGIFRLERGMTVTQGIVQGGGLTQRGTERGIRIQRRDAGGEIRIIEPALTDPLERDDIIFVRESLFY
jgi:polysaccharide export outer membrane protein